MFTSLEISNVVTASQAGPNPFDDGYEDYVSGGMAGGFTGGMMGADTSFDIGPSPLDRR